MNNLNILAPWNSLGYGVASSNIIKALWLQGVNLAYWPIGTPQVEDVKEDEFIRKLVAQQKDFDCNAPSLRIWHQFDMAQHVGKGMRIGLPIFELDRFNEQEVHHLSSLDRIIVCSNWAKEIIEKNDIKVPTYVAPLGVNIDIFKEEYVVPNEDAPTVFLNIGKWEKRKGHDVLAEAFNRAFGPHDNVELWMMNHNPFLKPEQERAWLGTYLNTLLGRLGKIKILKRVASHREVADVMRKADCGVFPSRAEGWNLEALEMLACGKRIIITDYSAHTEFCTEDNSYLVNIHETELAEDGVWFYGQGDWAKIGESQIEEIKYYMQAVHKLKQEGRDLSNPAGTYTAEKLSWHNTAGCIKDATSPNPKGKARRSFELCP